MVDEQNVEGSVQDNSETPQVMNEQTVAPESQPQAEETQEVVAKIDPDEKILSDMFDSGKTEVSMNELVTSGFNTSRMAQFAFEIGSFRLSKLTILDPYKIEKKQ